MQAANKKRLIIIGSGPTGIGAAYRVAEKFREDVSVTIIDEQDEVGGLASTRYGKDGFNWDLGGHVTFSTYDYFNQVLEDVCKDNLTSYKRSAYAYVTMASGETKFVPYPVQKHLECFPQEDQELFATSKGEKTEEDNFGSWLVNNFGKHLTEIFMRPYNKKVWTVDPSEMNVNWVKERVAVPTDSATSKWGPNSDYRYPKEGGTGRVWKMIADTLPAGWLKLSTRVQTINPASKSLTLASTGEILEYDYLITTIPLPILSKMTNLIPEVANLKHSSSHIIGFGFRRQVPKSLMNRSWIYFAQKAIPFYRITPLSQYSGMVPDEKHFSVLLECADASDNVRDSTTIIERSKQSVCTIFDVDEADICSVFYEFLPFGYPIPSLKRDSILSKVIPELEKHSIYSRGRFGGYKYEVGNQDHSFMQGVELIDYIFENKSCTVYKY